MYQGKKIVIKEDPSLTKSRVSLKNMMKSWKDTDMGFLIECRALEMIYVPTEVDDIEEVLTVDEPIVVVLKKFDDGFAWPETLPP